MFIKQKIDKNKEIKNVDNFYLVPIIFLMDFYDLSRYQKKFFIYSLVTISLNCSFFISNWENFPAFASQKTP